MEREREKPSTYEECILGKKIRHITPTEKTVCHFPEGRKKKDYHLVLKDFTSFHIHYTS